MAQTEKKRKSKEMDGFLTDSDAFKKKILGENRGGPLQSTPAEIDSFLHNKLKDPETMTLQKIYSW